MEQDWRSTKALGFSTRAIHAGQAPDPTTGATIVPLYLTSTYTQTDLGEHRGYEYGRADNPTRKALETALASLENGRYALTFGSGMAAIDVVIRLLAAGDGIVAGEDLYGGAYRLFERVYRDHGIITEYANLSNPSALMEAIRPESRLLWLETPTNPLLRVADIEALARAAHEHGMWVAVDNTFATPYLQNPLDLGADLVVHSMTKYIGGHSDVLGGVVITNHEDIFERLKFLQNAVGSILGAFEAWLLLRGIKTLGIRMARHQSNATLLRDFLQAHPQVDRVFYPGSESAHEAEVVARQMRGAGAMLSFEIRPADGQSDVERVREVVRRTQIFALAESLGGVESLIGHPATMTHAAIPAETRQARGISDRLIRVSVGIEEPEDLIRDLDRALA
jgi:cystathionine beta-lyase/cystathionine gamma-synthase